MSKEDGRETPWQLILSIATIIAAVAFLAKIFGKDVNDENDQRGQRSREDLYKKTKPSFADYRYLDWAKTLTTALMLNSTEDEDAVYKVFNRMRNLSDVVKTIDFFGTKRKMFTTQYITLPEAIAEYFNPNEKKKLNDILAKKRIDYTFD